MNITNHIDEITLQLKKLDKTSQIKFAAWCCFALVKDALIKDRMIQLTKTKQTYQMIDAIIQGAWYDFNLVNVQQSKEFLHSIDIDEELSNSNNEYNQGAIDLISSTESLIEGISTENCEYLANCAEHAINWKDHLVNFPKNNDNSKEKQNLENEYSNQILYLQDLSNGRIGISDISKYRLKS